VDDVRRRNHFGASRAQPSVGSLYDVDLADVMDHDRLQECVDR
jgi:hypothetical protein